MGDGSGGVGGGGHLSSGWHIQKHRVFIHSLLVTSILIIIWRFTFSTGQLSFLHWGYLYLSILDKASFTYCIIMWSWQAANVQEQERPTVQTTFQALLIHVCCFPLIKVSSILVQSLWEGTIKMQGRWKGCRLKNWGH